MGAATSSVWDVVTPWHMYRVGAPSVIPSDSRTEPGLERSAGPSVVAHDGAPLWSPDNPMFWFGAFLLVTFGAAAASTNLRVGKFRASVAAGDS